MLLGGSTATRKIVDGVVGNILIGALTSVVIVTIRVVVAATRLTAAGAVRRINKNAYGSLIGHLAASISAACRDR